VSINRGAKWDKIHNLRINAAEQKLEGVWQSLRIEQDNWRMLSDETRQILDNDGNFKYQLSAVEDRLNNLSRRITKLEPEPPPAEDWGDMP